MVERKVYNGWAFTQNEQEKGHINREIYNELMNKYKIKKDIVISRVEHLYHHSNYCVSKAPAELSDDEILLILDGGNLCFGGCKKSIYDSGEIEYTVFED